VVRAFVELAAAKGGASSGHHNKNYVLPLTDDVAHVLGCDPGIMVTVRIRRRDALPVVIRTWHDEPQILNAIQGVLAHVPRCLYKGAWYAIHSYVDGVPLSKVCANEKPVESLLVKAPAGPPAP
jgi:predicted Ser/Thr protein kinase